MLLFKNAGPFESRASKHLENFFRRHFMGAGLIYDHGCGFGGWTEYITSLIDAKAAIFDPDAEGSKYTQDLLGDRLSNSEGPYDAIMCFGVLELLEKEEQVQLLQQFAGSLKGRLVVQYNVYNPLAARWIMLRLLHGNPIKWHQKHRFHRTYFSRSQVESLFSKAGFSIVEKCHPVFEGHLPFTLNRFLGPLVPSAFHMTFYYALEKQADGNDAT